MTDRQPSREFWLLLAITALGAFLRFFRLDALPPGDGYDVAQYGVDALHILAGARPIFLESNFGREALFSYLVAAVYAATGPGTLGIRIASAAIGTATIPAVYLAARELLTDRRDVLRYAPLLAALLAAVSYWHLNWSRMGLRVILVPLVASLLFYFLWRGLRRGSYLDFVLAGLLLGIGFYTYQAARLLPVLVLIAFALWGLSRRSWTRRDTTNALVVTGVALLVFLPLGVYARENPGALNERINQATLLDTSQPLGPQVETLASQALRALAMYGIQGDADPLGTIAGRPSLDPILFAFLLLGIGAALWRFREPAYLFLLAWLVTMTAPAMIADLAATAKRALGAFPPTVILIAFAMLLPWAWLRERWPRVAPAYGVLLGAGLVLTTWQTCRDYFVVWAADPDLPAHFQVDHQVIGRAIGGLPADERVYLSPYPPEQPVIQLHSGLRPDVRGYNGRFCVLLPDPTAGSTPATSYLVVPGLGDTSMERLGQIYPAGELSDGPLRPNSDRPYYRKFRTAAATVPEGPPLAGDAAANWSDQIALASHAISAEEVLPGETLTVDLLYQPLVDDLADYTAFVHLLGPAHPETGSPLWAQTDSEPCGGAVPTGRWQPGDLLWDVVELTLPADLPPGEYQLATGFYSWPDLVRLPLAGSGETAVSLGRVVVRPPE